MKIDVNLNIPKVASKLSGYMRSLQPILDMQVLKDSNFYAPMDTGNLMSSVITGTYFKNPTKANIDSILQSGRMSVTAGMGKLVWNAPYAKKMYYGVNYNFSKDSNPNARAKWFEEAKSKNLKAWEKILNADN